LPSYPVRLSGRIHSQRRNPNPEAAEVIAKLTEFRQLTETERSPIAAIEDEQKRAIGQQRRKAARHPRGVGKNKILGKRTNLRIFDIVQSASCNRIGKPLKA